MAHCVQQQQQMMMKMMMMMMTMKSNTGLWHHSYTSGACLKKPRLALTDAGVHVGVLRPGQAVRHAAAIARSAAAAT
jgi:hypothetical protein